MSSESSPEETSNAMTRLNIRSDSEEAEEQQSADGGAEPAVESPQNMQSSGGIAYSRTRRALARIVCEEDQPSTSVSIPQVRCSEPSTSAGPSDRSVPRRRPPSNSVNSFHLEARPQGSVVLESASLHRPPVTTYNWQGTKTTMRERFSFLFNNEILSDVSFLVGRGAQQQRIPAHKLVLAAGSAVFDAMFNGTLATSASEIEVPDIEPAAFLAVLLFLYTDEIQIDPETVMTTLYTAKKYAVSPLEKHCVDFLRNNLTSDNAFLLLTQARLFDEPQLAAVCLDTIDKFTTDAFNADGFTDVDIDTLMVVLERDTLRIRESKIFHAVVRWSEAECARQQLPITPENQRSVLGRALSLVRFPLMSVEEFAGGPAQSGLLTDREVVSVFLYFTVNPKPSVGFEAMPRCCMMGKEQTVCRFQQTEKRWGYSGTSDRVRFSVDRRIFLVGYGVYGSIHGPAEYDVKIELIHTASTKVIATNHTSFSCDGSRYTYRLMFKEPAEILPNTIYTASAMFKGPDSHYGCKGLRKVDVDCGNGDGKVRFQFSYAAGNNNGTSVEDGQIPELIFYT
ncbi:BTB/POZ domain-containing protein 1-like isoform X2 [Neodiprion virginianus]|uniref:BTB/POZ domain-containing protein 1-like isoform X2 n=1 Tax=Neodiprion fabricii TaxID=2872261 RepID=UPI001ED91E09|nr:BTB/POZ domain-containing protein 1-like isoform X2 [Neodiprion fabricii]XP_046610408.1 BTB/POZ domain-containing protein 1-like isoform X2 [Neodiprion virginianus]